VNGQITITYDNEQTSLKRIIATLKKNDMTPEGNPVNIK